MTELSFEAATDFSHSLLTNYTESCGGPNCVISPISIFLCLSMLKYGARGTTKSELDSVLFTPSESSGSEAQDIMRSLKESSDSAFKLNIANGIFIKDGFTPSSEFLIGLHYDFGARAQIVDLGSSAGVDEVNKWVKDETNGKITKLMAKPDESVMALINAVYMNAKWDEAFYEGSTKKGDFKVSDEKTVQVDLMQQTAEFKYVRDDDAKFVLAFFPYLSELGKGKQWEMGILLPDSGVEVAKILPFLKRDSIKELKSKAFMERLDVKLPKFRVEASVDMVPIMKKMGMERAFTDRANFSGISESGELKVTQIHHKCYIDVDEEGTEASAVAAIKLARMSKMIYSTDPVVFE